MRRRINSLGVDLEVAPQNPFHPLFRLIEQAALSGAAIDFGFGPKGWRR